MCYLWLKSLNFVQQPFKRFNFRTNCVIIFKNLDRPNFLKRLTTHVLIIIWTFMYCYNVLLFINSHRQLAKIL